MDQPVLDSEDKLADEQTSQEERDQRVLESEEEHAKGGEGGQRVALRRRSLCLSFDIDQPVLDSEDELADKPTPQEERDQRVLESEEERAKGGEGGQRGALRRHSLCLSFDIDQPVLDSEDELADKPTPQEERDQRVLESEEERAKEDEGGQRGALRRHSLCLSFDIVFADEDHNKLNFTSFAVFCCCQEQRTTLNPSPVAQPSFDHR